MSPVRGQEHCFSATMQRTSQDKSKEGTKGGFGSSFVDNGMTPAERNMSEPQRGYGSQCRKSSYANSQGDDYRIQEHALPVDTRSSKYTTASVKSMSSTENSRRDSAISASSQQRCRPKTSRSNSKRSLQSAPGDSYNTTTSWSSKQRPRRLQSTGAYHPPQANIEEALALHARSCQIFAAASRPTTAHASSAPYHHPGLHRSLSSTDAFPISQYHARPTPFATHAESPSFDSPDEDESYASPIPATVTHWTSEEARKRDYAAIDRANSGVRGLLKKVLPKWVTKGQSKFYEEDDGSDAGSVRRIRLDLPVEQEHRRKRK